MTADASAAGPNLQATGDDRFRQALGELARKIGERTATKPAANPVEAAEQRRAALSAYDRDRLRHWMIGSSIVLGSVALLGLLGLGMMWLPLKLGRAGVPVAELTGVEQRVAERSLDTKVADTRPIADTRTTEVQLVRAQAALPEPARAKAPAQPVVLVVPAVPESPDVSMAELKAWAEPTPGGLSAAEIREVQGRLLSLGFNPGRIDGAAGPNTKSAVSRYRERRNLLPANGTVDYNLLTALRREQLPRVAQRPQRSTDPFEPIVRWWRSL